jgi:superfamily II DNA or RNA helicase
LASKKRFQKRLYQIHAAKKALTTRHKRLLIVAPGGSGKTVIAALITQGLRKKKKQVLLLSHRREIVEQTRRTIAGNHQVGIIMAGVEPDPTAPIQIASVHTLKLKNLPKVDHVIVDEAHHSVAKKYAAILKVYRRRGVSITGLDATPYRLDGIGLKEQFDVMYEAVKPSKILGKYIMKPRVFSAAP